MTIEPASHRVFEHTADVGIEVEAPTRDELFAEAAIALCDTVTARDTVRPRVERDVELQAPDEEILLVDFLNEVLYLFDTERLVFSSVRVELRRTADAAAGAGVGLRARLRGERYDESRHPLRSLVKAVTYHGLMLTRDGGRHRARVLFDV